MPTASIAQSVAAGDLSSFRGAHATGTIPIREHLINSVLNASSRGAIQDIEIRIGDGNRLQVGVRVAIGPFSKWFRPELVLDPQALWGDSPGLLFTISASHYGAVARIVEMFARGALPPGVQIGNNKVAVNFGAIPQAAAYQHCFQHIKRLQVTTRPGVVWVDFDLRVNE